MASALNRDPSDADAQQPLAIPGPPPWTPVAPEERVSVLIVDDDEKALQALTHVLEPLGQNIVRARSGEEALRWLLREEFAVILLDMSMPGLDGLQTARYVHARARTRHIPIIFLTAHADDTERISGAHAAGAVDYVAKPFDAEVLRAKVAVFVELHRARAERVHEAHARAEAEGVASTITKLQSISDAALAHLELEDLLPEILRRARAVFAAETAGVLLTAEDESSLVVLGPTGLRRIEDPNHLAAAASLLSRATEGTIATALAPEETPLSLSLQGSGGGSLIAAPLRASRKPLGVMFLVSPQEAPFAEDDLVVLSFGAERAAIALDHARSYERERGLVEVLQEHLLPDRLPRMPGLAMAARYQPGERLTQVGGDWYDAIPLARGGVGLVIGDVVGHGIEAATLMAELRAALRAYAITEPESPARTIAALNALAVSTHKQMVATLLYVVVQDEGAAVRFASAGHLPPLVLEADGDARFLSTPPGAPLGVARLTRYEDVDTELEPGSTLLLYTDGLIERRGEAIDTGLERLARSIRSAPDSLEGLCAHVLQSAEESGGIHDDTALVAVRRLAVPADALDATFPAEPRSVPDARHRLERWLAGRGLGSAETSEIVLAASEAFTNAVEHAYGPDGGATFRVFAESAPSEISISVSDSGSWRPPRGSERGLGLKVMSEVMDSLDVQRTPQGTTVGMTKYREENGTH